MYFMIDSSCFDDEDSAAWLFSSFAAEMRLLRISGIASKHFSTSSADTLLLADIFLADLENLRLKSASFLRSQNSAKHRWDYWNFFQIFSLDILRLSVQRCKQKQTNEERRKGKINDN